MYKFVTVVVNVLLLCLLNIIIRSVYRLGFVFIYVKYLGTSRIWLQINSLVYLAKEARHSLSSTFPYQIKEN